MRLFAKSLIAAVVAMSIIIGGYVITFNAEEIYLSVNGSYAATDDYGEIGKREELRLIAVFVDAVCEGEPYMVKVAISGVLIGRAISPEFPNTVAENIFSSEMINLLEKIDLSNEPSADALNAVRDASYGLSPCPDAKYFLKSTSGLERQTVKSIKLKCGSFIFV